MSPSETIAVKNPFGKDLAAGLTVMVSPTLERLLADDPDGLARLRAHQPAGNVTTVANSVAPVVAVEGRKLHSGRDPLTEARRFVRALDLAEATVVILLGFASGHVVRAIRSRTDAPIYVFEPSFDILAEGVGHGEVPANVTVITSVTRLGELLYARLAGHDRGTVVRWVPSLRTAPALYAEALAATSQAIDRASLRHRTARTRGRGWLTHYIENLPALVTRPGLPALAGVMSNVPAIIVAAGPSLDRNVAQLRELQNSAFILCVNTAAGALARAGVQPHAIVAIESLDVSSQLRDLPFIDQVPAFLELTANPALWDLPVAQQIPISVDTNSCAVFSARLDRSHFLSAGFCVANAATSIAYVLGCAPIILVGSDLAYRGDRIYAEGTSFERMRAHVGDDGMAQLDGLEAKRDIEERSGQVTGGVHMPDRAKTQRAPAWGGEGQVTTTRDFLLFRDWYSHAAKLLADEGIEAINATEGGLQIPGWTDMPLAEALTPAPANSPSLRQRFATHLDRSPTPASKLHDIATTEQRSTAALIDLARKALRLVGNDPDGDLHLHGKQANKLKRINAKTRELLHDAPLASEAIFAPIENLRASGRITAHAFYGAMLEPLADLEKQLARLLQRIEPEKRRTG